MQEDVLVLEQGKHKLRIETADDVLLDDTIEVEAGEQTVALGTRRKP